MSAHLSLPVARGGVRQWVLLWSSPSYKGEARSRKVSQAAQATRTPACLSLSPSPLLSSREESGLPQATTPALGAGSCPSELCFLGSRKAEQGQADRRGRVRNGGRLVWAALRRGGHPDWGGKLGLKGSLVPGSGRLCPQYKGFRETELPSPGWCPHLAVIQADSPSPASPCPPAS